MNKLLQRQLQKHFGNPDLPENFTRLLNVISDSYDHYEKDRRMIERSIELSSKEMIELNSQVKKSGKDELQKMHNQLKMLFENIEEIFYTVDIVSLKITQISAACEKVYGYTSAEFIADRDLWQKVILPEDINIVYRHIKQLYEGKHILGQYRIIHKDKSIRWLESKIVPTLDEAGQLIRMDGVTNDITERKHAEEELEKSFSLLEATLESTADGILVADYNGKIVRFNNKFAELGNIPRALLDSRDDENAIAFVLDQLTNPEEFVSKVKELYAHQKEVSFDILKFKDGRIFERYSQPQLINGNYVGRVWSFRDITDRKKAEDKIRESELRYRSLIEQASDAICIADPSMKLHDINPSGIKLLGYSKEEFLQLSVIDLFPLEDLRTNPFKVDKLNPGESISDERRFKRKDGTLVDVEVNAKVLEDGRFMVIGRDISERKQAEKSIKENELRYRNLIEQATDAICIADSSMKFIDVNSYACQFLGYSKEEALQLSVTDVLFTEDLASNPFKYDDVQPGEIIRNERRFKRKDGTSVIMEVSTRLTEDGRFIMFGHDVSARRKSEEALRESEKRLRQIIDLVPHFIFAKDATGKFVLANKAVASAYGCMVEALIGKTDADFNARQEEVEHFIQEDLKVITSGNVNYNIEETITDADGNTRILSTTKIPYTSPGLTTSGVLGVSVDITERKKAEKTLLRSEAKLELKNDELELKNKELEQFVYVASHDLQEPLRTTSSFTEFLQQQYKGRLDEKADQYLTFITQSSDRMKVLINDLLDYSRIGRKKAWEKIDCNIILQEVLADLDAAIKETGAEIEVGHLPVINGYPTEIKQLFQNLVINAVKFRKINTSPQINIAADKHHGYWEFTCKDNGIGMEEQHKERIFVIFQRLHTRNEYEGSGIGLAHCKKIVELHGGKIWVESRPGEGATFHFSIPEISN